MEAFFELDIPDTANLRRLLRRAAYGFVDLFLMRASGFGAVATGAATRAFIEATRSFHELGKPLIADYAGGLAALAAAALGGVGGFSHGMIQKESFRISDWKKPATGGGSSEKGIYVPELDRFLKEDQLTILFSIKGTRARFGCNDTACCAHGAEDMIENPHRHFIIQRNLQTKSLSEVPEARRTEHFLLHQLDPAVRSARLASRLKINDESVAKLITESKKRLINLRDSMGDLHLKSGSASRSAAPRFRGKDQGSQSAVG